MAGGVVGETTAITLSYFIAAGTLYSEAYFTDDLKGLML